MRISFLPILLVMIVLATTSGIFAYANADQYLQIAYAQAAAAAGNSAASASGGGLSGGSTSAANTAGLGYLGDSPGFYTSVGHHHCAEGSMVPSEFGSCICTDPSKCNTNDNGLSSNTNDNGLSSNNNNKNTGGSGDSGAANSFLNENSGVNSNSFLNENGHSSASSGH